MTLYPYSTQSVDESDERELLLALRDSHLTQGPRVKELEKQIAAFCGSKYALCFNSATSALFATYHAIKNRLKTDTQNYAITTPISFVATSNMLLANNIFPIFADVLPNGSINPKEVRNILQTHKFRESVSLLVSVDYAGLSVECEELQAIAEEYNLLWISDSSHAFGARYKGKRVGALALASVFSFHAIKPITTAEGGALLTNDKELYESACRVSNHGITKTKAWNCDCTEVGFNFRMNELSAALGLSQLRKLEAFITRRNEIASFYDTYFAKNDFFSTLSCPQDMTSTRHLYPILLYPYLWCAKEDIFNQLHSRGVGVQVHYKPIYQFSLYKKHFGEMGLKNADEFYLSELSIPCTQTMELKDAKIVASIVLEVLESFASKPFTDYKCRG